MLSDLVSLLGRLGLGIIGIPLKLDQRSDNLPNEDYTFRVVEFCHAMILLNFYVIFNVIHATLWLCK